MHLSGKVLELLKEAVPNLSSVALFIDAGSGPLRPAAFPAATEALGLSSRVVAVPAPDAIEPAFAQAQRDHVAAAERGHAVEGGAGGHQRREDAELAEQFDMHPNQITQWRSQLLDGASGVFGAAAAVEAAPEGSVYVCPMHPEIVQAEPGACPKCGMALEPRTVSVEEELNPELVDMARRFWVALAPAAVVFLLAMSHMLPGHPVQHLLSDTQSAWAQFILSTPVVLWAGWPFFQRGWMSSLHRSPNMFTLIAIGTGTAYLYSVMATLFPSWIPPSFHLESGAVPVYFEAAAVITVIFPSSRGVGAMACVKVQDVGGAAGPGSVRGRKRWWRPVRIAGPRCVRRRRSRPPA